MVEFFRIYYNIDNFSHLFPFCPKIVTFCPQKKFLDPIFNFKIRLNENPMQQLTTAYNIF